LRAYQRILPQIHELGAQLVAVSPQSPDASLSTAEKNALQFEVLSDADAKAAGAYRILFGFSDRLKAAYMGMGRDLSADNADGQWHLPIPATYVIGQDGRVELAYIDPEYRNRLEPADILEVLKKMRAAEAQVR
jgi:peroxiredoxin